MSTVRFHEQPVPATDVTGLGAAVAADPPPPTSIPVTPTGNMSSTNMQAAFEEQQQDIDDLKTQPINGGNF